jgi:hypothetical protein
MSMVSGSGIDVGLNSFLDGLCWMLYTTAKKCTREVIQPCNSANVLWIERLRTKGSETTWTSALALWM